jgi:ParB/RepB/Spo0J family partition protein
MKSAKLAVHEDLLANNPAPVEAPASPSGQAMIVPVLRIRPSPLNPRKRFEAAAITELAGSIKIRGLIEPLVVRLTEEWILDPSRNTARCTVIDLRRLRPGESYDSSGLNGVDRPLNGILEIYETVADAEAHLPRYELLAGERRWRACIEAGLENVPVMVREGVSDRDALELMLSENDDREELDPLERARAYVSLQEVGYTQSEIAERIHRSQPVVANTIRLLQLPESVQERIAAGELTGSHGAALVRWAKFPELCEAIARNAIRAKASVADLNAKGIPFAYHIPERLARQMVSHECHFDPRDVCKNCPFDAYIPAAEGVSFPYCLNHEHFMEVNEAARKELIANAERLAAERQASEPTLSPRAAETLAAAGQDAGKCIDLNALPYGSYIRFYRDTRPAGCGPHCSCNKMATGRGDKKPVEICIDPGHHNALKAAETRERKKVARVAHEAVIRELRERRTLAVDRAGLAVVAVDRAGLAVVAWSSLRHLPVDCRREAIKDLNHPAAEKILAGQGHETRDNEAWRVLATVPAARLIDLMVESMVRRDHADLMENGGKGESETAEWLLRQQRDDPEPVAQLNVTELRALQGSNQRAREEADAAKTEIVALRTELNRVRAEFKAWQAPPPLQEFGGLTVGDRVKVIAAVNAGLVGTIAPVAEFFESPIGMLLTLDLGGGIRASFAPANVELVTAEPAPDLAVGDRVLVSDECPNEDRRGMVGVVKQFVCHNGDPGTAGVRIEGNGRTVEVGDQYLQRIEIGEGAA